MRALTLFVLGTCLSAGTAFAQPSPSEADTLFEEGRLLLEGGRAEEACPKFEASQRLDPARGTLINIGACYAATGRLVEALAVYKDVEQQSQAANDQTRVQAARTQIAQLEKLIPHVKITYANPVPGSTVELNGIAVPAAEWSDHRRNPGQVTVRAHAAGHKDYSETVTVKAEGATTAITIPALEPITLTAQPLDPRPTPVTITTEGSSSRKTIAFVVGGAGIALFGGATAMAFVANSRHEDALVENGGTCAKNAMDDLICGTQDDADATVSARKWGNIATVIGAAGIVAAGAGVVLYLTAPKTETMVTPTVSPDGAGVSFSGTF